MAIIGHFMASKDGGWEGTVQTLSINAKVRLVPNDNQASEKAPSFRVFVGKSEIGAAWNQRTQGDNSREYLSVKLDDPSLPEAISAAMFEGLEGREAQLIWNRRGLS